MTKPRLDQGADYERGFVDGAQHQMKSSVDLALEAMRIKKWVGLTDEEIKAFDTWHDNREEEVCKIILTFPTISTKYTTTKSRHTILNINCIELKYIFLYYIIMASMEENEVLKKENEDICSTCGKKKKFNRDLTEAYNEFCSHSCSTKNKKTQRRMRSTNFKRYGDEVPLRVDSVKNKKIAISISINPEILKLLDDKTSNRSNYLDWALLEYFNKIGSDTSKIKL